MKKKFCYAKWLILSALVIGLDLFSKHEIVERFNVGQVKPLLPFLNLTLAYNRGTAFSLLNQGAHWQFWFLTGIALVVSVAILYYLFKGTEKDQWQNLSLSLILGGALGNVWDRLTLGVVVDFIDFHIGHWHFATFNIADAAITLGAAILVFEMLFKKE